MSQEGKPVMFESVPVNYWQSNTAETAWHRASRYEKKSLRIPLRLFINQNPLRKVSNLVPTVKATILAVSNIPTAPGLSFST